MNHLNRKIITYAAIPTIALALAGAGTAYAHGWNSNATPQDIATHQQERFQKQADLLGVSLDTVKNGWAQGKTLLQLAQNQGIDQAALQNKITDQRKADLKTRLQTLVGQGVITQAQADQRLAFMEQHMADKAPGRGMGMMFGGAQGRHGPRF